MGNFPGTGRKDPIEDEEAAVVASIAQGVAAGASVAVLKKVREMQAQPEQPPEQQQQQQEQQVDENAAVAGDPEEAVLVAGVLPVRAAQRAAAGGAIEAVRILAGVEGPVGRRLASKLDLMKVQAATAAGAATAIWGLALAAAPPAAQPDHAPVLGLDDVVVAVSRGAWSSCYNEMRTHTRASTVNRWVFRLPPVLATCIMVVATTYPRLNSLSDWEAPLLFGGLIMVIATLVIGVLAIPLMPSMSAEDVSRHAAFASFIMIIIILIVLWCFLFSNPYIIGSSAIVGAFFVAYLIYQWCASSKY